MWFVVVVLVLIGIVVFVTWIRWLDGDATDAVLVARLDFERGDLPPVCAKTGDPAAIGCEVGRRRIFGEDVVGIVPLSQTHHDRFLWWKSANQWTTRVLVASLVISFVPGSIGVVFGALAISSFVGGFVTKFAARALLVDPNIVNEGVVLRGVHPDFVTSAERE